mmetsp:Transcript_25006/g.54519  ORF Transcript_25006/g.54519 Transcript_25006/m.54519 type:complete len:94 (+) Transcript_25006:73-354(+)
MIGSQLSRSALVAARRAPAVVSRRTMSAEPKMHKAAEWETIVKSRPEVHDHLVFEGDYPKLGIGLGVAAVVIAGYGTMAFGLAHQQYKQGYWK